MKGTEKKLSLSPIIGGEGGVRGLSVYSFTILVATEKN